MVTSPFLEPNGWIIDTWTIDEQVVDEGIPDKGFQPHSILLIGLVTENFYSLQWLDQNGQSCSVAGLQSDPPNLLATMLEGEALITHFGLKSVLCKVMLILDSTDPERKKLTGFISAAGSGVPETGSGTFTATANPGT
jgi:hypothetical protein